METSDKILKWFNKYFRTISFVFGASILLVIAAYILRFYNYSFSTKPEHWGQVGDYLGGFLNPIIAIGNLAFLIYLTLLLKNRDDNAHKESIKLQKTIAINSFRNDAYKVLLDTFKKYPNFSDTFTVTSSSYIEFWFFLIEYKKVYGYLFESKEFEKRIDELIENCANLNHKCMALKAEKTTPIEVLKSIAIADDEGKKLLDSKYLQFGKAYSETLNNRVTVIKSIQDIILDKE